MNKLITAAGVIFVAAAVFTSTASASSTPYVSPAAARFIASAPVGSCLNNWNRVGCVKPKRIVMLGSNAPMIQRNAQCSVYWFVPERSVDWVYGTAVVNCVGGANDEGVWAELKMLEKSSQQWKTAAVSHRDKLNHDGLARERAWSHCTGGWGTPRTGRWWETLAHGFYTINWTLYLRTVESRHVLRYCIHNV